MKTVVLFFVGCIIMLALSHTEKSPHKPRQENITSLRIDSLGFKTDIQPILQKNCTPCHFPGGKMYGKMPFDKGETIINHEAGVLRRFNDKKENALIKQFIEQSKLY